jgi:RsiW-degrading membrane proteinase PrsW (M82 family)
MLWVWWSTSPGGGGVAAAMLSVPSVFLTLGGLAAVGLLILGYCLPAIIASRRKHPNTTSITLLTLLLGWTLIGWVVALVWSTMNTPTAPANSTVPTAAAPQPKGPTIEAG